MKKLCNLLKSFAFIGLSLWSANASALAAQGEKPHTFELTPEFSYWRGGTSFLGIAGQYRYNFDNNYLELDLGYGHSFSDDLDQSRIRGFYGHHFDLRGNLILTPYAGLGYRRIALERFGFNFSFSSMTLPLGLTLAYYASDVLALKLNGEYEYHFRSHVNVPIFGSLHVRTNLHSMKLQPTLEYRLDSFSIEAKPYLRYITADRPKFSNGLREIGFGLGFKF